jgi:hypothetical protein
VVQMRDMGCPQAVRAILTALQLDTFVAHPVKQIEDARWGWRIYDGEPELPFEP